jgi:hypothetical protein
LIGIVRSPQFFLSGFAAAAVGAQASSDENFSARRRFLIGSRRNRSPLPGRTTETYQSEDDMSDENTQMEALYDQAADIADKHLVAALEEAGALGYLVGVMMVEASVNAAAEATSREDIVRLLKDLTAQIEQDIKDNPGE